MQSITSCRLFCMIIFFFFTVMAYGCGDGKNNINHTDNPETSANTDTNDNMDTDTGAGMKPGTWYRDSDADGYGDPADEQFSETQPPGYVDNRGDCNDSDPAVNGGAIDGSTDGSDQNCDGYDGRVYFADDFEHGLTKWQVTDADVTWGLEEDYAGGGNYVLSDSPGTLYPSENDVSATMAQPIDLSGAVYPVLTFWQKYALEYFDIIRVEYSSNGTDWTVVPDSSVNNLTISTYKLSIFDLSGARYHTPQALFRFRLNANRGTEDVSDGWRIDKVVIRELDECRTLAFPYSETFENGLENWEVSGLDWQVTSSADYAGAHAVTDSDEETYLPNTFSTLVTKGHLNLMSATVPELTFRHRYSVQWQDAIQVYVSVNGGIHWINVYSTANRIQADWIQERIDLSEFRSNRVKIMFLLNANSDVDVADGWVIDDIQIGESGVTP